MEVKRFDDAHAFYERTEPFLVKNEAENNLILGLTRTVMNNPKAYGDEPPFMIVIERDGFIVQAMLRTPPHNVILSTTSNLKSIETAANYVRDVYGDIPGIVATSDVGKAFAEYWCKLTEQTYKFDMNQRIYQLNEVIPVAGVNGSMRQATETDRELLTDWFIGFNGDAMHNTPSREAVQPNINRFLDTNSERYLGIWEVDSKPVSMAGATGPTPNGIRIGAVYTPPELRRRGYASACVATLSQLQLDKGRKFCFLYTDLSNPTSNKIYQNIGYRPICDSDEIKFED